MIPKTGNFGRPAWRSHREPLQGTLLGHAEGPVRCPHVRSVALQFGVRDPVATLWRLLHAAGFSNPEELRQVFPLPEKPLVCRIDPAPVPRLVRADRGQRALEDALWLGLATPWLLDPARPVLWTRASLTRCIEVFDTGAFYS
ncbi:MAG: hypothetical protein JJT85_00480 [Chromatiales bacterium]|nr:hypothetical protein [Chromatiales bacterium]